jgi:hypothetical protein
MSLDMMNAVWYGYPGSGNELLGMLALADWSNDFGGNIYPSIAQCALKMRLSERQARRVIHKLIDDGWIEVVANHAGGAPTATRQYRIIVERLLPLADAAKAQRAADYAKKQEAWRKKKEQYKAGMTAAATSPPPPSNKPVQAATKEDSTTPTQFVTPVAGVTPSGYASGPATVVVRVTPALFVTPVIPGGTPVTSVTPTQNVTPANSTPTPDTKGKEPLTSVTERADTAMSAEPSTYTSSKPSSVSSSCTPPAPTLFGLEQQGPAKPKGVRLAIPLSDGTEYMVTEKLLEEWKLAFPQVDVAQSLRNIREWCKAKPTKRKTRRGVEEFLVKWLIGDQDKASRAPAATSGPTKFDPYEFMRRTSGAKAPAIEGAASRVE